MLQYKVIEIFTSENVHWRGQQLHTAVVQTVNEMKLATRCIVTRGIEGSYENGEIATGRIEVLSYNMPVRITVIVPAVEFEKVLSKVGEMVTEGIVAVRDVEVVSHKTREALIPRNARVREIMTPNPKRVGSTTPVSDVAKLLLSSSFTGLPVVDEENHPIGVIAQADLIYKAELPLRIGLLAHADRKKIGAILDTLKPRSAKEVMTHPAVIIEENRLITEAVEMMLKKKVKRLPVVDDSGKLVGMISRVDIFRAAMTVCPDFCAFQEQGVDVQGWRYVSDIMRRDTGTVLPDTPVEEIIRTIDCNDIQRICVVDQNGYFKGLISDRDLLIAFSERHPGVWEYFARKIPFTDRERVDKELKHLLNARTAAEVMNTQVVTVLEDTSIEEAITFMLETTYKRLPVLDSEGKFKGMISRDSLLGAIFAQ
jgi:CBS domain-containing protein